MNANFANLETPFPYFIIGHDVENYCNGQVV